MLPLLSNNSYVIVTTLKPLFSLVLEKTNMDHYNSRNMKSYNKISNNYIYSHIRQENMNYV